jgi:CRP-like cAMP-binding protein
MAAAADLATVELFQSLTEEELGQLAESFDVKTVGAGVTLVTEGASGYSFFVLLEGSAVVKEGDKTVALCDAGDFFGEIAILGDSRRTATVTTSSPAKLLVMFGTEFRRLQQVQPAIAAQLEGAMRQRRNGER